MMDFELKSMENMVRILSETAEEMKAAVDSGAHKINNISTELALIAAGNRDKVEKIEGLV